MFIHPPATAADISDRVSTSLLSLSAGAQEIDFDQDGRPDFVRLNQGDGLTEVHWLNSGSPKTETFMSIDESKNQYRVMWSSQGSNHEFDHRFTGITQSSGYINTVLEKKDKKNTWSVTETQTPIPERGVVKLKSLTAMGTWDERDTPLILYKKESTTEQVKEFIKGYGELGRAFKPVVTLESFRTQIRSCQLNATKNPISCSHTSEVLLEKGRIQDFLALTRSETHCDNGDYLISGRGFLVDKSSCSGKIDPKRMLKIMDESLEGLLKCFMPGGSHPHHRNLKSMVSNQVLALQSRGILIQCHSYDHDFNKQDSKVHANTISFANPPVITFNPKVYNQARSSAAHELMHVTGKLGHEHKMDNDKKGCEQHNDGSRDDRYYKDRVYACQQLCFATPSEISRESCNRCMQNKNYSYDEIPPDHPNCLKYPAFGNHALSRLEEYLQKISKHCNDIKDDEPNEILCILNAQRKFLVKLKEDLQTGAGKELGLQALEKRVRIISMNNELDLLCADSKDIIKSPAANTIEAARKKIDPRKIIQDWNELYQTGPQGPFKVYLPNPPEPADQSNLCPYYQLVGHNDSADAREYVKHKKSSSKEKFKGKYMFRKIEGAWPSELAW